MDNNYNQEVYQTEPAVKVSKAREICIMAATAASYILSWIMFGVQFSSVDFSNPYEMPNMNLFTNPVYLITYILSMLVGLTSLVLLIVDFVKIYKAGKKIVGLILFGLLLRPGYFIWREYILEESKVPGIIFAVLAVIYFIAYLSFVLIKTFSMVAGM